MKQRSYGLDFFRFFGAFIVLAGHLTLLITYAPVENIWGYFSSPLLAMGIISLPVPVFIMISGYFGLARPNREDEVKRTFKSFLNILYIYAFWTLIMVTYNMFINGGAAFTTNYIGDLVYALFNPIIYAVTVLMPLVSQGLYLSQTAPLWYLFTFAGFVLLAPIFRAFFTSADKKLIRVVMVILFVGTFLWPNINFWAKTQFPNSPWVMQYFGQSALFDLNRFGYSLLFYYLFGAWLKTEGGYKNFIAKVPYWAIGLGLAVSVLLSFQYAFSASALWGANPTVVAGSGAFGSGYESILLFPGVLMIFMLFNKLDSVITEDTKLGHFVKKHSSKTLGIYVSHVFIIAVFTNLVGYINVNTFLMGFENGFVQMLIHFLYAIGIYLVSFGLVSLLRLVPVIKKVV